jgi:hypothetical protein
MHGSGLLCACVLSATIADNTPGGACVPQWLGCHCQCCLEFTATVPSKFNTVRSCLPPVPVAPSLVLAPGPCLPASGRQMGPGGHGHGPRGPGLVTVPVTPSPLRPGPGRATRRLTEGRVFRPRARALGAPAAAAGSGSRSRAPVEVSRGCSGRESAGDDGRATAPAGAASGGQLHRDTSGHRRGPGGRPAAGGIYASKIAADALADKNSLPRPLLPAFTVNFFTQK